MCGFNSVYVSAIRTCTYLYPSLLGKYSSEANDETQTFTVRSYSVCVVCRYVHKHTPPHIQGSLPHVSTDIGYLDFDYCPQGQLSEVKVRVCAAHKHTGTRQALCVFGC